MNKDLNTFVELTNEELQHTQGGVAITILGTTYVGAKAIAILAGGGTALVGAAGWGVWVGFNESRRP